MPRGSLAYSTLGAGGATDHMCLDVEANLSAEPMENQG